MFVDGPVSGATYDAQSVGLVDNLGRDLCCTTHNYAIVFTNNLNKLFRF